MQQQIWGEVVDFNLAFFQFIWECNSENIIKIDPYLPKLLQEKFGAVFFCPPCISDSKRVHLKCENSGIRHLLILVDANHTHIQTWSPDISDIPPQAEAH